MPWRIGTQVEDQTLICPFYRGGMVDFVFNLDVDHPSTVSTITRTGSKLVFKGYNGLQLDGQEEKEWGICPFCGWSVFLSVWGTREYWD